MWKIGVRVFVDGGVPSKDLLPSVLDALGTGPWDSHVGDDVLGNWATWDARLGGSAIVREINWIHVQFVPST